MAAAVPPPSFATLLAEDSDFALPASDPKAIQSLIAYGAIFSRAKKEPKPTERLEILAGMLWLHTNHASPHTALARASAAQQQLLATALGLDYGKLAQLESWPTIVSRHILAQADPGDTPLKRKAPAPAPAPSQQIVKPGPPAQPTRAARLLLPAQPPSARSLRARPSPPPQTPKASRSHRATMVPRPPPALPTLARLPSSRWPRFLPCCRVLLPSKTWSLRFWRAPGFRSPPSKRRALLSVSHGNRWKRSASSRPSGCRPRQPLGLPCLALSFPAGIDHPTILGALPSRRLYPSGFLSLSGTVG
jgi:hypothetical protein